MALLGAEVYDNVVDSAGLANLDKPALAFAESLRSPGLDAFVTAVGGKYLCRLDAGARSATQTVLVR